MYWQYAVAALVAAYALIVVFSGHSLFVKAFRRGTEKPYNVHGAASFKAAKGYEDLFDTALQWWNEQAFVIKYLERGNVHLGGYLLKNDPAQLVVLLHGYRSFPCELAPLAMYFSEHLGMSVFVPALRGHDISDGRYITFGTKDSKDLLAWLDALLTTEFDTRTNIAVVGCSMGAATMLLAAEKFPEQVKCLVSDGSFSSLREQLAYALRYMLSIARFPALFVCEWFYFAKFGLSFNAANVALHVRHSKLPILFIHGKRDMLVSARMAHKLFEEAGGEKALWMVQGARHANSIFVDPNGYAERVKLWVTNHFAGQSTQA